jgi:chromate reductase
MAGRLHIIGISGSLRRSSFNTMALHAAIDLAPAELVIEPAAIGHLPLYNEDLRGTDGGLPADVTALRQRVAAADGVLLVTPEYNYGVPGPLKNAFDWLTTFPDQPFTDKPVAIMSASTSLLGGARAQYQLRQHLVGVDAKVLNVPEVMIAEARERFAADGRLTHEPTRKLIVTFLGAFAAWIRRLAR